jgi:hypothetical protein
MRVQLQLVLCSEDGQAQTVTDVVTLQFFMSPEAEHILDALIGFQGLMLPRCPRSAAPF